MREFENSEERLADSSAGPKLLSLSERTEQCCAPSSSLLSACAPRHLTLVRPGCPRIRPEANRGLTCLVVACRAGPRPSLKTVQDAAIRGAMASSLAFAMSTATPVITSADMPSMAVSSRTKRPPVRATRLRRASRGPRLFHCVILGRHHRWSARALLWQTRTPRRNSSPNAPR